jgi:hypothetical protein
MKATWMSEFIGYFTMLAIGIFIGLCLAVWLDATDWRPYPRPAGTPIHAYETPV